MFKPWKWCPSGRWRKVAVGVVGVTAVTAGAFFLGRGSAIDKVEARGQTPRPQQNPLPQPPTPPVPAEPPSDYTRRVVAYIYGTIPVTREHLGEYLIARMGTDRLEPLVNRMIIEHECAQRGITVVDAEIEADLAETAKSFNVTPQVFAEKVLGQYNKTLYEWKEDVIRPKLLMSKLVRDRVTVTPEDLAMAFEAYHGKRVECQVIYWLPGEREVANKLYARIRDNADEFDRQARMQANTRLAASGGKMQPIGRHTTGNEEMERTLFSLQVGEVSALIGTPDGGTVVFKILRHLPPDTSVTPDMVRSKLEKEIIDKKIQREIPIVFKELRARAKPTLFLKNGLRTRDLIESTEEMLQPGPTGNKPPSFQDVSPTGG
jgi:hypothetical protein